MTESSFSDIMFYIVAILVILIFVYYLLGIFGFLPQGFYEQCEDIDLETAQLRGCCEDRPAGHPVSWFFGPRTCDKYRVVQNGD